MSPLIISGAQAAEIKQLVDQQRHRDVFQLLKELQKSIQLRHKKTQVYSLTIAALQRQHRRRVCEDRLLVKRHEASWSNLAQLQHELQQEIITYTKQIQEHDEQLVTVRSHAHQRYEKYKTRQKQFYRFGKIPLLGGTYKRKYLRSQRKNLTAESDVAACRLNIDCLKKKRSEASRQIQQKQEERQQLKADIRKLDGRISAREMLTSQWNEGLAFWTDRMARVCLMVDQRVVAVQHLLRKSNENSSDSHEDGQKKQELISVLLAFHSACVEYEETEAYGQQRQQWILDKVDFDCAKCMQYIHQGKPTPSKISPSDILCDACYQSSRTTMIIKKKLGFLQSSSSSPASSSSLSAVTQPSASSASPYSSLVSTPPLGTTLSFSPSLSSKSSLSSSSAPIPPNGTLLSPSSSSSSSSSSLRLRQQSFPNDPCSRALIASSSPTPSQYSSYFKPQPVSHYMKS